MVRAVVLAAAVLAFGAGLILDPAGVVRMALFCAAGGYGVPGRAVVLGGAVAVVTLVALRRWRMARRPVAAVRSHRPRPVRPPQGRPPAIKPAKAPAPPPARTAARQTRRKG